MGKLELDRFITGRNFGRQVVKKTSVRSLGAAALLDFLYELLGYLEARYSLLLFACVVNREDDVLVELAVHGEFPGLTERLFTAIIVAFKGFLAGMDVSVLFQVLCEIEALEAEHANVLFNLLVGG